jgi:phosphoribosylformylglycinamidine cyclo-ligase
VKYKDSGVNIDTANKAKQEISKHARSTWGKAVLSQVGAFGGLYQLDASLKNPVLVSSIDGVGTKLMVAQAAERFDTIGQDLVNHCVNDILVQGARPLFFLDYFASGTLNPSVVADVVKGLSNACRANGCALIGGETAEMPGLYQGKDFDLAGCIVGVVERKHIIDGSRITAGDRIFALPSSGLHTNGYSLARNIVFDTLKLSVSDPVDALGCTIGEALLQVHVSYLEPMTALVAGVDVKGIAHITGGGIIENVPRILPASCDARIHKGSWNVPPLFRFLAASGDVDDMEMYRVFNMGAGMLFVAAANERDRVMERGRAWGVWEAGGIVEGNRRVQLVT